MVNQVFGIPGIWLRPYLNICQEVTPLKTYSRSFLIWKEMMFEHVLPTLRHP